MHDKDARRFVPRNLDTFLDTNNKFSDAKQFTPLNTSLISGRSSLPKVCVKWRH